MTKSKKPRHVLVVAAGHDVRLRALAEGVEALATDQEMEALREEADALLGGGPSAAPSCTPTDVVTHAPAPPGSWQDIIARNRMAVEGAGRRADDLRVDDLLDDETLARVEREWGELVAEAETHLDERRIAALSAACRRSVIDAIVRPFGLGHMVARLDRIGGSVLTLSNAEAARQGRIKTSELANAARAEAYAERQEMAESTRHRAHNGDGFLDARRSPSAEDAYTGLPLDPARTDIDHVLPASLLDKDMRINFHFDEQGKEALINAPENLAATDQSINRSKGSNTVPEWLGRSVNGKPNVERFPVDEERMRKRHEDAERHLLGAVRSEDARYYLKETATAAAGEAVKLGLQQALGALLIEVTIGIFDELDDLVRKGRRENVGLAADLKDRASRVIDRVLASWKDVVAAFKQGALGGLVSAIVTAVINMFVTTAKRLVRIIREGALSLARAVGMLVNPPVGMDLSTAAHEASKIAAAALAVSAGVMVEQSVETAIVTTVPPLATIAPALTTVAVGLVTGLSTVLLVATLDRFDFFGAVASQRGKQRRALLDAKLDAMVDAIIADGMSET